VRLSYGDQEHGIEPRSIVEERGGKERKAPMVDRWYTLCVWANGKALTAAQGQSG
jgi:hypothetical protein